ncbi:MAG: hypothetical protein GOMPHAMPRED_000465 [Gomphillus americanus]|uniref:Uncharacterized protein n=1 Tax=Gomphillus americanus TaxID=1940652 RepID=A0A8H3EB73_9LECA|nr:MAG: hypothetical protein GOMPHAMPRED_000465 [Gomphillus americanus]
MPPETRTSGKRRRAALVTGPKKTIAPEDLVQRAANQAGNRAHSSLQTNDQSRRLDLPPVIPDDCSTDALIRAYEMKIITFHVGLIRRMEASPRTFNRYFSPIWLQWFGKLEQAQALVYQNLQEHLKTARVYYLPHFIAKTEIPRFLAAVPAMCTANDGMIHLQSSIAGPRSVVHDRYQSDPSKSIRKGWLRDGNNYSAWTLDSENSTTFHNLSQAIKVCPRLLNIFERRRSRMKCIASSVDIFATHGYVGKEPQRKTPKNIRQNIIAITGVAPQFGISYLDYADFILEEDMYCSRLECYQILGQLPPTWANLEETSIYDNQKGNQRSFYMLSRGRIFHAAGYLQTMKDSFFLWLRAFDDQVRRRSNDSKGYLQIPAMGCDTSSLLPPNGAEVEDLADMLTPLLVQAIEQTLEDNYFPNITKIGFCDFSGKALFCPTRDYVQHVSLIPCPGVDLCQFDNDEYKKYVCGLLVPGNSFSLPGNELGYDSIEAQIGINTSLRVVQCYIHNENLIDPRNHIAVDGPCMLFAGRKTKVKTPCIISDEKSVQDYTWTGAAQPIITGTVQREKSL